MQRLLLFRGYFQLEERRERVKKRSVEWALGGPGEKAQNGCFRLSQKRNVKIPNNININKHDKCNGY